MTAAPGDIALSRYDQGLGVASSLRLFHLRDVLDVARLARALERTYQRFPRLATRLVVTPGGESKLTVMERPPPLELRAPIDWAPSAFIGDTALLFANDAAFGQPVFAPVLRPVRGGGAVLGVNLPNVAGDVYSLYLFMSQWCAHIAADCGGPVGPGQALQFPRPGPLADVVPSRMRLDKRTRNSFYSFDREHLDSLKSELAGDGAAPTTNEALTAFLVHRHGRKLLRRSTGLRLRIPVNVRGIHPDLPNDYIGNGVVEAVVPLDDLTDTPVAARHTARRIHDAIRAVRTKEYVEATLPRAGDDASLAPAGLPVNNRQTDMVASNVSRMHIHTLDFGNGPPVQVFNWFFRNGFLISSSTVPGTIDVAVGSEYM